METLESLNWLKENNLFQTAEQLSVNIKKVFSPCLGVKDEKVLVVGDTGLKNKNVAAVMSGAYFLAAQQLNLDTKLIFQTPKSRGDEAENLVYESLAQIGTGSVIILNMSDKLGSIRDLGKSFRKWAKKKNHRFVSAMSLGDLETEKINLIIEAMDVSYKPFQASHDSLKKLFNDTNEIRITTDAGTDLTFNIEGIAGIAADGNYTAPGTGGNLPAGEVYAPPNGKNVQGKVVIDGSSRVRNGTILVKNKARAPGSLPSPSNFSLCVLILLMSKAS